MENTGRIQGQIKDQCKSAAFLCYMLDVAQGFLCDYRYYHFSGKRGNVIHIALGLLSWYGFKDLPLASFTNMV